MFHPFSVDLNWEWVKHCPKQLSSGKQITLVGGYWKMKIWHFTCNLCVCMCVPLGILNCKMHGVMKQVKPRKIWTLKRFEDDERDQMCSIRRRQMEVNCKGGVCTCMHLCVLTLWLCNLTCTSLNAHKRMQCSFDPWCARNYQPVYGIVPTQWGI